MKKFLLTLSLLLSATTIPLFSGVFTYTPNQNPAVQIGSFPSFDMKGMIMQTILQSPSFEEERANIKKFLGISANGTINQTYQTIVAMIHNAPSDLPGLIETIEALEKALMHYIHTQNYVLAFENKWLNICVTGVRWSWINPINWIRPSNWYSDNSPALQACMQELLSLAAIAERHSSVISFRMKTKAESYLHWRKHLSTAIATYFAANLIARGWHNSSLKMLKNGGLSNTGKILNQSGKDIEDFTNYTCNTTSIVANKINNFITPVVNLILYGDQANESVEKSECLNNSETPSSSKEDTLTNLDSFTPTTTNYQANTSIKPTNSNDSTAFSYPKEDTSTTIVKETIDCDTSHIETETKNFSNNSEGFLNPKENKEIPINIPIDRINDTAASTTNNKSLYQKFQTYNAKLYKALLEKQANENNTEKTVHDLINNQVEDCSSTDFKKKF